MQSLLVLLVWILVNYGPAFIAGFVGVILIFGTVGLWIISHGKRWPW